MLQSIAKIASSNSDKIIPAMSKVSKQMKNFGKKGPSFIKDVGINDEAQELIDNYARDVIDYTKSQYNNLYLNQVISESNNKAIDTIFDVSKDAEGIKKKLEDKIKKDK